MSEDLTALGDDGIRRSFDEHYGTMMDVGQDPTGAMWAIHKQVDRIEELEAKLEKLERWQAAAFIAHGNLDLDIEANPEALAEMKGQ